MKPILWEVRFLHTYRSQPSLHNPKGAIKTVSRRKTVEAKNAASAIAKARRSGTFRGGSFHDFQATPANKPVTTRDFSEYREPSSSL